MKILKKITLVLMIVGVIIVMKCIGVNAANDINVPASKKLGTLHTYTVWDKINWGSSCKTLKNYVKNNNAISNNYGIVTYGSYFCGALTPTYGKVGDLMLVIQSDYTVYPVIMADTKNMRDKGCNKWGHKNGKCIVEFEILSSYRKSLYGTSGGYISDELSKPIIKVINIGSIYDNTNYLWNPKQACIDNGLFGYKLLHTPYDGSVIYNDKSYIEDDTWKKTYLYDKLLMMFNPALFKSML